MNSSFRAQALKELKGSPAGGRRVSGEIDGMGYAAFEKRLLCFSPPSFLLIARDASTLRHFRHPLHHHNNNNYTGAGSTGTADEPLLPSSTGAGGAPPSAWWNPSRDIQSSAELITGSWLNVLIILCPLGIISEHAGWGPSATFLLVS